MVTFADRLKGARVNKGYNQPELAKLIDVSKQSISAWERGDRFPDEETILKLADVLGVTRGFLLGDNLNMNSLKINNYNYTMDMLDKLVEDGVISEDDIPDQAIDLIVQLIKADLKRNNKKE